MKLKSYIAVSLCAFALAGCSDDDRKIGVTVDGDAIEIGAEGGTRNIKVTADDAWIATTNDPWITISPANGRGSAQCRIIICLLYTSPSPRDVEESRMPSSA